MQETTNKRSVSDLSPEEKRQLLAELKRKKAELQDQMNLSESDRQKLLFDFNQTEIAYPSESVLRLIEKQIAASPDNRALISENQIFSYRELNEKANQLARELQVAGVKKGDFVPILLPQQPEMIWSILAVMKLGAIYVPLDLKFPSKRIEDVLEICEANCLIGKLGDEKNSIMQIDPLQIFNHASDNLEIELQLDDIAYTIFTSGSTGIPKGVLINHRALANLCHWFVNYFTVTERDQTAKFAGAAFDVSVAEIFPFLMKGACIHFPNEETKQDPAESNRFFEAKGINIAFLPTQFCQLFMELENSSLTHLITAGEKLKKYTKQSYRLHNLYGPTENTVYTTYFEVTESVENIPIGKALANNQLYVLNFDSKEQEPKLVPIGMKGELCVSGDQIAMGYLKNEAQTAEKFVAHPFLQGKKLYRTGDLASILPDGTILYHGRIDKQLKIRGYRIEPGEIEFRLLEHTAIKNCVVLEKEENGTNFLVCFFEADQVLSQQELRSKLADFLPDYMIPSYFRQIDQIPVNTSGKVDQKQLDLLDYKSASKADYVAPTCEAQAKIVSYWKEMLHVGKEQRIGIHDNFFEIGGNSLLAIKTVSKMSRDYVIRVNQLFEYPTIEQLSQQIAYRPDNIRLKIKDLIDIVQENESKPAELGIEKRQFLRRELQQYRTKYRQEADYSRLEYNSIMLTGSLGYLGIHLLKEFLLHTKVEMHLLIRAANVQEAQKRLESKLKFYFPEEQLFEDNRQRIKFLCGDLSQDGLGLDENEEFHVDCIVHVASKTSHYGEWDDFYEVNVRGTQRIIDFAKKYGVATIQGISTISTGTGKATEEQLFFSEYSREMMHESSNYYVQSKIEAEKLLMEAASPDLKISLHRIGNLMPAFETGRFQENATENAFMNTLKLYFEFKLIPDLRNKTYDFSYVDETAKAIRLLAGIKQNTVDVFHITNATRLSDHELWRFISPEMNEIELKSLVEILEDFLKHMDEPRYGTVIEEYIANSKILDSGPQSKFFTATEKTRELLLKLGYEWKKPNSSYFNKFLKHLKQTAYFHSN